MKKNIFILMLVLSFFRTPATLAYDEPFSLGLIGGFGLGAGNCDGVDCTIPNITNSSYNFATVLITGAYRFSEQHSTRIGVGIDRYFKNSPYTNSNKIFVAAEGYYVYHFTDERKIFSPYFLAGFRVPTANIGLGLGNEFLVANSVSIVAEILANTFFTLDQRFEGRLGVLFHF